MNHLIRAFAEQIFVSGFIHCDPHPGNVFVRPHPDNHKKHQLVILDFGLSLEISEKFRVEYASFWKNLFAHNVLLLTTADPRNGGNMRRLGYEVQ